MSYKGLECLLWLKLHSFLLFEPLEPLQALIWHDVSPLKYHKFKIQAQENNEVRLFEEMTNASAPSE